MELLDRYLRTIRHYLPAAEREDIIRELSANLLFQMEDREADLGRPLTESEQRAILKQHGDPIAVAGRYRKDHRTLAFGRQLIGPVLFPLYAKVLRINLSITFVVCMALLIGVFGRMSLSEAMSTVLLQLSVQFAIVTLIFILAETQTARFPEKAEALAVGGLPKRGAKDPSQISPLDSFAEMVALGVFLAWLLIVWRALTPVLHSGAGPLRLAPVWDRIYVPTVLVTLAGFVKSAVNLFRPRWIRFHQVARVVIAAGWLALVGFLLRAPEWVVLTHPGADPTGHDQRVVSTMNHNFFFYSLLVTAAVFAVHFVLELRRLVRRRPLGGGKPELHLT